MVTVWWWVVKPGEAGANSRPADAKLVSTPDSGPAYNAWVTGGTYNGETRFQGPFNSQAEAKAAPPGGGSIADQITAGIGAGLGSDVGPLGTASRSLPTLSGLDAIGRFFSDLGNPVFWIRLGKILAGGLLLILGLAKLTGVSEKAGSIAGKAVKVAPFL